VGSILLLQGSARAAPDTGTNTGTDTSTTTTTHSTTNTGTDTDTSSDLDTYTGVCLSMPVEEKDSGCRCSAEPDAGDLVFLAPALLALGRRRRRREALDRLAAHDALPADVIDRLRAARGNHG
jgi:MYXO-CTERM domain-containing protein